MTWNEIYVAADGKACGDFELKRKDTARFEVVSFIENNFGFDIEKESEEGLIECVEDWVDAYVEKYNISFDEDGHIESHSIISIKDKASELLSYYYGLPDRSDKDFDTLDAALNILQEIKES